MEVNDPVTLQVQALAETSSFDLAREVMHLRAAASAPSIWSSVECDAWSRDYNWDQYMEWHAHCKCRGQTLTIDQYDAFRELMNQVMEDDLK